MSHEVATRNIDAEVRRPPANRVARIIGMMSRYWVDPEMAADDTEDRRLAVHKAYLVNFLGLTMFIEKRYGEGRKPIHIHHLPLQDGSVVESAISLLNEQEVDAGIADELRALVNRHPFELGSWPKKPGWTHAEAIALGVQYEKRGGGRTLQEVANEMIFAGWVTVRQFDKLTKTQRLPHYVDELNKVLAKEHKGEVSVEYIETENGVRPHASYHYFEDDGERAEWEAAAAEKERMKQKHIAEAEKKQADNELARQEARARRAEEKRLREEANAHKTEEKRLREQQKFSAIELSASRKMDAQRAKVEAAVDKRRNAAVNSVARFSGWKSGTPQARPGATPAAGTSAPRRFFSVTNVPAPVRAAPPASVLDRLGTLQARTESAKPRVEVRSAAGVPADVLNERFPRAASKEVVVHDGCQYMRRFEPRRNNEGQVIEWLTSWGAPPAAV